MTIEFILNGKALDINLEKATQEQMDWLHNLNTLLHWVSLSKQWEALRHGKKAA